MMVLVQQDVGRLEVKVPDVDGVKLIQALQNFHSQGEEFCYAHWPLTAEDAGGM